MWKWKIHFLINRLYLVEIHKYFPTKTDKEEENKLWVWLTFTDINIKETEGISVNFDFLYTNCEMNLIYLLKPFPIKSPNKFKTKFSIKFKNCPKHDQNSEVFKLTKITQLWFHVLKCVGLCLWSDSVGVYYWPWQ